MTTDIIGKKHFKRERVRRDIALLRKGWDKLRVSNEAKTQLKLKEARSYGADQLMEAAFWFAKSNLKGGHSIDAVIRNMKHALHELQIATGFDEEMLRDLGKMA